MKTVLAILLLIFPFAAFAQTPDVSDNVATAIRTGNAKEIQNISRQCRLESFGTGKHLQ